MSMNAPKKPIDRRCPRCGRLLRKPIEPYRALSGRTIKREGDKFCPSCGQAIDWRKENNEE